MLIPPKQPLLSLSNLYVPCRRGVSDISSESEGRTSLLVRVVNAKRQVCGMPQELQVVHEANCFSFFPSLFFANAVKTDPLSTLFLLESVCLKVHLIRGMVTVHSQMDLGSKFVILLSKMKAFLKTLHSQMDLGSKISLFKMKAILTTFGVASCNEDHNKENGQPGHLCGSESDLLAGHVVNLSTRRT